LHTQGHPSCVLANSVNDRSVESDRAEPGVLLVSTWYGGPNNGVGLVVESLAQSLHRAGTAVAVLELLGDGWRPRIRRGTAGEEILSVCFRDPGSTRSTVRRLVAHARLIVAARAVRRLVRRRALRVAHFHYSFAEYDLVRAIVTRLGLSIVATFHGNDLGVNMDDSPTRAATERLLRAAAVATTVSASLGRRLVELFPFVTPIARTIHNAIPQAFLTAMGRGASPKRDIDVLFAGNLIPRKGVDVLLAALPRACDRRSELRVVVAGDGPERTALESLAASLGLRDVVRFVGQQDREAVVGLFQRARVAVVPSRAEPFGLVVVEAMAAGARVVASDVGGIPEIAAETGGALLVPPDDPEALARAIVQALGDPAGDAVAAAASERALTAFSPDVIRAEYDEVYRVAAGMDCAHTLG